MAGSQDRISALPDNVRVNILSFLPNEDAARTAILSKAWNVWNLSFDEELKLSKNIEFFGGDFADCFPALKVLELTVSMLTNEKSKTPKELMKKLFGACPMLEDLSIHFEHLSSDGKLTFNVTSRILKRLCITVLTDEFGAGYYDHEFVVEAPKLEYIHISDDALLFYEVDSMPNIGEAIVDVGFRHIKSESDTKDQAGYAFDILNGITNTRILDLSDRTMAALSHSFDENTLPTFPNLINLRLGIHICFGWKLLTPLLENSPILQVLNIDKEHYHQGECDDCEEDDDSEEDDDPKEDDDSEEDDDPKEDDDSEEDDDPKEDDDSAEDDEVESASSCLSCLKKVNFTYIMGDEDELEVIGYLLGNAKVLEKMVVGTDSDSAKQRCQKILKFPKASKKCEIEIH